MSWRSLLPLMLLGGCTLRPDFIPPPQQVFKGFQALPRPVRDLPVGALWIDGIGAYGPGAADGEVERMPGISSVAVDSDLAASLSLGFLQYLDLDPTLRTKVAVRLNDVTLVRVKDLSRLEGPGGQPRIYEALRVGSATITASREAGLAIEARALERGLPVFGRGSSGGRRTFTLEAKDVYLAVHVATLRPIRSKAVRVSLKRTVRPFVLHGLRVAVSGNIGSACLKAELMVSKGTGVVVGPAEFDPRQPAAMTLAAPIGTAHGLFQRLAIAPDGDPAADCAVRFALDGTELVSSNARPTAR